MLDSDKGFYLITGYPDMGRHFIVDVQPTYASVAVFKEADPAGKEILDWDAVSDKFEAPVQDLNKSGMPDNSILGAIIAGLPTADGKTVECLGRTTFTPEGMVGRDELSDYSLLDITLNSQDVLQSWSNRFSSSRQDKIDTSFRYRAKTSSPTMMAIFWPFRVTDLAETRIEILANPSNVTFTNGTVPTGEIDGPVNIVNDGRWYEQFYFHVEVPTGLTVPAGGTVDVPIQLKWNKPGAPTCKASAGLKVEALSGYAPHKRITTDANGSATVRVSALGLTAGETVKAKFNMDHFSNVGQVIVEVV